MRLLIKVCTSAYRQTIWTEQANLICPLLVGMETTDGGGGGRTKTKQTTKKNNKEKRKEKTATKSEKHWSSEGLSTHLSVIQMWVNSGDPLLTFSVGQVGLPQIQVETLFKGTLLTTQWPSDSLLPYFCLGLTVCVSDQTSLTYHRPPSPPPFNLHLPPPNNGFLPVQNTKGC